MLGSKWSFACDSSPFRRYLCFRFFYVNTRRRPIQWLKVSAEHKNSHRLLAQKLLFCGQKGKKVCTIWPGAFICESDLCSQVWGWKHLSLHVNRSFRTSSLLLAHAEWGAALCLQKEIAFRGLRTCVAHRNLLSDACIDFKWGQRSTLLRDEIVFVSLHDGLGKIFPGPRMWAEDRQAAGHQRYNAVGKEIWCCGMGSTKRESNE